MKKKFLHVFIFALIVLVLDHLSKWLVVKYIAIGDKITIIPGIFDLVHGRNPGAAFGLLSRWDSPYRNLFFYIIGFVALIFLYFYLKNLNENNKKMLTFIGLILGGALGNLSDRLIRGSVVDFLSVHYDNKIIDFEIFGYFIRIPLTWPAFNVADMAISCSLILIIFSEIFKEKSSDSL